MKRNIKEEIIKVSKQLFNEQGYNNVSIQNIADTVGISKGNLTYHFKRKEDIIEEIVQGIYLNHISGETPTSLKDLNDIFITVQSAARENAFYFWHYTQISQVSPKIGEMQSAMMLNNYKLFYNAFQSLNKDGILQDEEYPGQYEEIIKMIMLTCIYWTPHRNLTQGIGLKVTFNNCIWGVILPLFTSKGKQEYEMLDF